MQEDHATHRRSAQPRRLVLTEAGERALAAFNGPVPYRLSARDHEQGEPLESVPPLGMVS